MNSVRTFSIPQTIPQQKKSPPSSVIHIVEIWDHIFSFLSCREILPTRLVSRSWCSYTTKTINNKLCLFSNLLSKSFDCSFSKLKMREANSTKPVDWEEAYESEHRLDQDLLINGFENLTVQYKFHEGLLDRFSFRDTYPCGNVLVTPLKDSPQIFLFFHPTDKSGLKTEVLDCEDQGELSLISNSQFKVCKRLEIKEYHYHYDLMRAPVNSFSRFDLNIGKWEEFYSKKQLILRSAPVAKDGKNQLQLKIYQTDPLKISCPPTEVSLDFSSEIGDFCHYEHEVEINENFFIVESTHVWGDGDRYDYCSFFQIQTGKNILTTTLKIVDIFDETAFLYDFDQKHLFKANLKKEHIDPTQDLEKILYIDYPDDSLFTSNFYFFIIKNQIVIYDLASETTHKQDLPKFEGEIRTGAEFVRVTSQLMMILTHTQKSGVNSERMLVFEFSNGIDMVFKEQIEIKRPYFSSDSHIFQVDKERRIMTILQYAPSPDYKLIERGFTLEKLRDLDD